MVFREKALLLLFHRIGELGVNGILFQVRIAFAEFRDDDLGNEFGARFVGVRAVHLAGAPEKRLQRVYA